MSECDNTIKPKVCRPFDLEAAKRGEPLVTRDGRKARFIAHVPDADEEHRLVIFIEATRRCFEYCDDGRFYAESGSDIRDLFMAPVVKQLWVNVYKDTQGRLFTGSAHSSEYGAKQASNCTDNFICTKMIEVKV